MTWLDATAQAELVRRGEVSPKELVQEAIARIEAVNPQLDAVIRTRFDEALAQAAGELPDGPFRGVPTLFKDLGCTVEGEVTAFGLGPMRDQAIPVTSFLAAPFRAGVLCGAMERARAMPFTYRARWAARRCGWPRGGSRRVRNRAWHWADFCARSCTPRPRWT